MNMSKIRSSNALLWLGFSATLALVPPIALAIGEYQSAAASGTSTNRPTEILVFGGIEFLRAWVFGGFLPIVLWTVVAALRTESDRWAVFLPGMAILAAVCDMFAASQDVSFTLSVAVALFASVVLPRILLRNIRPGTLVRTTPAQAAT